MANSLPITIQMAALPPQVRWTPQQLGDAIAARLSLVTAQTFALFVAGSTAPLSNVGPWLKDGTTWYVWYDSLGAYAPAQVVPTVTYAARAIPAVAQTIPVDTAKHIVNFSTEVFDPENAFAASRYTAEVDGFYAFGCNLRVDNDGGVAASMAMRLELWKNGSSLVASSGSNVPSPVSSAWFPNLGYQLIQLAAGDYIEAYLTAEDGTNSGDVEVQVESFFSANLVQEIV